MQDSIPTLNGRDRAVFKSRAYAHFATLMPDGSPHVSPVWIDVEDGTGLILVNSVRGRVKVRNCERDGRVALSLQDPDDPNTMLGVRGRVVEITADGAEEHIDFLSNKYDGQDFTRHGDRVLVKIAPVHVVRI
jgi:PPOX class probable F420-dependent enzyme